MPFFRHIGGISGVAVNAAFGKKYLYKWWVKACDNLGIKGVDLSMAAPGTARQEPLERTGHPKK